MRRSIVVVLAVSLLGTTPAAAKRPVAPRLLRTPTVVDVDTPLGLQRGRIAIPFSLYDPKRRQCEIDVQYGIDLNGDGMITDGTEATTPGRPAYPNEYRTATEDRLDPRNTRKNKAPQLFTTSGDIGAAQGFVWHSTADLPYGRFVTLEYKLTPQGRNVPDPDNPGFSLFATGPDGIPIFAGVKIRMRSASPLNGRRHRRPAYGAWAYTHPFAVDNSGKPSMTIDAAAPSPDDPSIILVNWTAFHPDSEDLNGDGALQVAQGEDINGDGKLFTAPIGVAFDWHEFGQGADPSVMTPAQLSKLTWSPCTRMVGVGDTDSLDARPGVSIPPTGDLAGVASAPPGVGRRWVFAWDTAADVRTTTGFILRARPFDVYRNQGPTVYSPLVVHPGQ